MTPFLRLLSTCLSVCLLAACDVPPEGAESPLEAQSLAVSNDGFHTQGTQLHGTPMTSVSFTGATVNFEGADRSATLKLIQGELAATMPLQVANTTASLQACDGIYASGTSRNCGWKVEGQGTCTPGTTIQLTSGACGTEAGSCLGNPMVRVCAGERTCEYRGHDYLASGDNASACVSSCPDVSFVCPPSGVYTALSTSASSTTLRWTLTLAANKGRYPATTKELRGTELIGATMLTQPGATTGFHMEVVDAINADSVASPEADGPWDSTGDTFLYRVRYGPSYGTPTTELCAPSAGPAGWAWAVPIKGVFNSVTGNRTDSTTVFTLGCESGVIAKCYRWGYKPWLDGSSSLPKVTQAHHACTRMARADYCGNGISHTQNGTPIRPWDSLVPNIIPTPPADAGTLGVTFEAGWKTSGPACLSHWRWKHLPAQNCIELNPPIYESDGGITNDCRNPGNLSGPYTGPASKCSQICDSAAEAQQVYGSQVFNESASNTLDGGVGN
ncbi:ADYC domain-containing protein [Pyxidicoccus sp. MSG2]|uniref:ADYC domain-containing protein n=1 Tax=Pyxidicoccus sp. MSG2 TaxID=2996790 RepID=UPI00226E3DA3|nr:ADYC domain-containing protein [Pyxidicoccus sp. MSG2]MCY1017009.1 ADYC domain-containing protein [Pyxidicoccus sp. MSG2]